MNSLLCSALGFLTLIGVAITAPAASGDLQVLSTNVRSTGVAYATPGLKEEAPKKESSPVRARTGGVQSGGSTSPHPSFDVATVKPAASRSDGKSLPSFRMQGRYLTANSISLLGLIQRSYQLQPRQILGSPDWASSSYFDVTGVSGTAGLPTTEQALEMCQKLLTDRFKLSFHRATRELPVYALEPLRDGPKLAAASGDPQGPDRQTIRPAANGSTVVTFSNTSMAELTHFLMQVITDQQVVDHTALKGKFDFTLTFTVPTSTSESNGAPDIADAVQQQLGLKLQRVKAPVEVIIIDHAERPSEN